MNTIDDWSLIPPDAGLCQECAWKHEPGDPHNAQTIYYQTKFHMEHGRVATWRDAMAHCDSVTQALWSSALVEQGIADLDGSPYLPTKETDGTK